MNDLKTTIGDILRNLVKTTGWASAALVAFALNLGLVLANYLATRTALELWGFEMNPLRKDRMLGDYFDAFLGDAALAHIFAGLMALIVAFGLFLIFHHAFAASQVWMDRAAYRAQGRAEDVRSTLLKYAFTLAPLALMLAPVVYLDLELFRFRVLAGMHHIEDPTIAVQSIQAWQLEMQQGSTLFAWGLVQPGTWGYLGLTGLSCLAMEICIDKTQEQMARTWDSVWPSPAAEPALLGYDDAGQPVYDPGLSLAYDAQGVPLEADAGAPAGAPGPDAADGSEAAATPLEGALFEPGLAAIPVEAPTSPVAATAEPGPRFPVVGRAGQAVTLSEVAAAPERYHWDPVTRSVWSRADWEAIHEEPEPHA